MGWTWDYVETEIDIPRLLALNEYWRQYPPLQVMVAAFMGYKAPPKASGAVNDPAEVQQLFSMFNSTG